MADAVAEDVARLAELQHAACAEADVEGAVDVEPHDRRDAGARVLEDQDREDQLAVGRRDRAGDGLGDVVADAVVAEQDEAVFAEGGVGRAVRQELVDEGTDFQAVRAEQEKPAIMRGDGGVNGVPARVGHQQVREVDPQATAVAEGHVGRAIGQDALDVLQRPVPRAVRPVERAVGRHRDVAAQARALQVRSAGDGLRRRHGRRGGAHVRAVLIGGRHAHPMGGGTVGVDVLGEGGVARQRVGRAVAPVDDPGADRVVARIDGRQIEPRELALNDRRGKPGVDRGVGVEHLRARGRDADAVGPAGAQGDRGFGRTVGAGPVEVLPGRVDVERDAVIIQIPLVQLDHAKAPRAGDDDVLPLEDELRQRQLGNRRGVCHARRHGDGVRPVLVGRGHADGVVARRGPGVAGRRLCDARRILDHGDRAAVAPVDCEAGDGVEAGIGERER